MAVDWSQFTPVAVKGGTTPTQPSVSAAPVPAASAVDWSNFAPVQPYGNGNAPPGAMAVPVPAPATAQPEAPMYGAMAADMAAVRPLAAADNSPVTNTIARTIVGGERGAASLGENTGADLAILGGGAVGAPNLLYSALTGKTLYTKPQDAMFGAADAMRAAANDQDQAIAKLGTAGKVGSGAMKLIGTLAQFGLLPEADIPALFAEGATKTAVKAAIETAARNLPRAAIAGGATAGTSAAQQTLQGGGTPMQALGEEIANAGIGTGQFLAPMSAPGNLLTRALTGEAIQQGFSLAQQGASHAIAPQAFGSPSMPDLTDPMTYLGAVMGAVSGGHAEPVGARPGSEPVRTADTAAPTRPIEPTKPGESARDAETPVKATPAQTAQEAAQAAPAEAAAKANPVTSGEQGPQQSTLPPNLPAEHLAGVSPGDRLALSAMYAREDADAEGLLKAAKSVGAHQSTIDAVKDARRNVPEPMNPDDVQDAAAQAVLEGRQPGTPSHAWGPLQSADVGLAGGAKEDLSGGYLDDRVPRTVEVDGKTIAPEPAIRLHENVESHLMHELGFSYQAAHAVAQARENAFIRSEYGFDPDKYQAALTRGIDAARHAAPGGDVPTDLDAKPYVDSETEGLLPPDHARAAPTPTPERAAAYFGQLPQEIGWEQRAGNVIRGAGRAGEGSEFVPHADEGEVVGRTRWIPKPAATGESYSDFWRSRPDKGLTESQAHEAFRKAAGGEKLRPIEQRFVDYAHQTAQEYAQSEAQAYADHAQAQQELSDAQRSDDIQGLRSEQARFANADHGEALSVAQWAARAREAGMTPADVEAVANAGTTAERIAKLSQAIQERTGHGTQRAPVPLDRPGDVQAAGRRQDAERSQEGGRVEGAAQSGLPASETAGERGQPGAAPLAAGRQALRADDAPAGGVAADRGTGLRQEAWRRAAEGVEGSTVGAREALASEEPADSGRMTGVATDKNVAGNQEPRAAGDESRRDAETGLPLNDDGTVTVYHHTSPEAAAEIRRTGVLHADAEPDVYVTTHADTDTGYGDAAVPIRVDPRKLQLDDEFPDGRKDFRLSVGRPGGSLKVHVSNDRTAPDRTGAHGHAVGDTDTGTKNAQIQAEREARNLDELNVQGQRDFPEVWARARQALQDDPHAGRRLAETIAAKPRPLSAEERAVLIQDRARIRNERRIAEREAAEAVQNGDMIAEAAAKIRMQDADRQLETSDKAARGSNYENALGLAMIRAMSREDYSMAAVKNRLQAKLGMPLNDKKRAQIEELHRKLQEKDEQIAALQAKGARRKPVAKQAAMTAEQRFQSLAAKLKAMRDEEQMSCAT